MTVKQKSPTQPSFGGIVVTAGTREQAIRNYAMVAKQESLEVLSSADGSFAIATVAGAHKSFLNPLSGNRDSMKVLDTDLEVTSSADQEDQVSVHYTMCSECNTHIIADACESVSNCPSCSTDVDFDRDLEDELESESSLEQELEGEQGIVVVASSFEEAKEDYLAILAGDSPVSAYEDTENQVSFISNSSGSVHYSPFYGEEVAAQELESNSSAVQDAADRFGTDAHYFVCADSEECGMHVLSSSEDITVCPSCSTAVVDPEVLDELEHASMDMDDDLLMDEDDDLDDIMLDDDMDMDLDDEDEDELDDLDDIDSDLDDDFDDLDDDFEVISSSDSDEDEDEDDSDSASDEDEDEDEDVDGLDDEEDEEDEDDDEELESDSVSVSASLDVMTAVASSTEGGLQADQVSLANVSVVAGENRWVAFHGATPVAVASESNVEGNLRGIFNQPTYRQACLKAIANDGVESGLKQFGFESIAFDEQTMQTVISKEIVAQADAKIAGYEQAQKDRDAKLMERLGAALATSIMGLNNGVFRGKSNPIISSLASTLKAAGIDNARELIDNVFEANAGAFNKLLVDQTMELISKSADFQNEVAEMVAASSFARKDGQESVSSVEQRLQPRVVPKEKTLESQSNAAPSSDFQSKLSRAMKSF